MLAFGALLLPAQARPIAASSAATESAFNALLSMPQGLPDDSSFNAAQPEGFEPNDQAALIAWLAAQQKLGANFNQYQHMGSMLHHALRAGLDDTALWLLKYGADPGLRIVGDGGKADGDDALGLAIYYRRWRVVDALTRTGAVKRLGNDALPRYWQSAASAGGADDAVQQLLKRKFPMPTGPAGACLLGFALDVLSLKLVLALPERAPRHIEPAAIQVPGAAGQKGTAMCSASSGRYQNRRVLAALPADEIARADAKLDAPLFPYLLTAAATPRDVKRLFELPIRRPFGDPGFTRAIVARALHGKMDDDARLAFFKQLPADALRRALHDEPLINAWLGVFGAQKADDFAWALGQVDDAVFARHSELALQGMLASRGGAAPEKDATAALARTARNWSALLPRLNAPIAASEQVRLLGVVPPSVWPLLFSRGYHPSAAELDAWIAAAAPDKLRQAWPTLKGELPAGRRGAGLASALKAFTKECRWEWSAVQEADLNKVRFLLGAGERLPHPLTLAVSCVRHTKPDIYRALLATGTIEPAPAPAKRRFERDTLRCKDTPGPALFEALTSQSIQGTGGDVDMETIQALDFPGDQTCAYLVSGGNVGGRAFIDDDSFYQGTNRLTPCLDSSLSGALLRVVDGKLTTAAAGEGAREGMISLRDSKTGQRYYLTWPIPGSTCDGGHPSVLFGWSKQDGKPSLQVLEGDDEARQAFEWQCDLDDAGPCFGLPSKQAADGSSGAEPKWDESQGLDRFIAKHWGKERQIFVQALLALDTARLAQIKQQGIAADWVLAALDAVTASNLAVDAKRQRTAWLFRNKVALAAALAKSADGKQLIGLVGWLPREDWRPVLQALGGNESMIRMARDEANKQRKEALACGFARALNEDCAVPR